MAADPRVRYNPAMATPTEKRKQSLYFPEEVLQEIQAEAIRQDRSLSWIVQQAWRLARERLMKVPSTKDPAARPSDGSTPTT